MSFSYLRRSAYSLLAAGALFAPARAQLGAAYISTPTWPSNNSLVNQAGNFDWIGPSTTAVQSLNTFTVSIYSGFGCVSPQVYLSVPATYTTTTTITTTFSASNGSALADGQYSWNVLGTGGAGSTPASTCVNFTVDGTAPTMSLFQTVSSTGGAIGGQGTWATSAVAATLTVQDPGSGNQSGLAVSTGALYSSDGQSGSSGTSGYGVIYSTNAGATWTAFTSSASVANLFNTIEGLGVVNGNLYAISAVGNFKNISTGQVLPTPPVGYGSITSLKVFKNNIYVTTLANSVQVCSVYEYNTGLQSWGSGPVFSIPCPTTLTPAQALNNLTVFDDSLYLMGTSTGIPVYTSADGSVGSWVVAASTGFYVNASADFNGMKVTAGQGSLEDQIMSSTDGVHWTSDYNAFTGNQLDGLAAFGKIIVASGDSGNSLYSNNGISWTQSRPGNLGVGSESRVIRFNGMLFLAVNNGVQFPNTVVNLYASADGTNWRLLNLGFSSPGTPYQSLTSFNGYLYAGDTNGIVWQFTPLFSTMTVSGSPISDHYTATPAQLTATGFQFATSTSPAICAASPNCAATNQVLFAATDIAGNPAASYPYAVLYDTTVAFASSTPTWPTGNVNAPNNFDWTGPSTSVWAGLGSGASFNFYLNQGSSCNSSVVTANVPSTWNSTTTLLTNFSYAYPSVGTLVSGSTYSWQVQAVSGASGAPGPLSNCLSFVYDNQSPVSTGFSVVSSTGGLLGGPSSWAPISAAGASIAVQDSGVGLAVSTSALYASDGTTGASRTSGYGVIYSTNAGASWTAWSSTAATTLPSGHPALIGTYNDALYAISNTGFLNWIVGSGGGTPGRLSPPTNPPLSSLVFNNALYVGSSASGGLCNVYQYTGGTSWTTSLNITPCVGINSLAVFDGMLYAAGPNMPVYSSTDGYHWNADSSASYNFVTHAQFQGQLFMGGANGVFVSTDGVDWTLVNATPNIQSLAVIGKNLVAVDSAGDIQSSPDGQTWTSRVVGAGPGGVARVARFNGLLIASDADANGQPRMLASADGVNWQLLSYVPPEFFTTLAPYNGSLYAGGVSSNNYFQLTSLFSTATIGGAPIADGFKGPALLTATGFNFAPSTSAVSCAGVRPCGATDQVIFAASDLSRNVIGSGPESVLIDTVPPLVSITATPGVNSVTIVASATDTYSGVAGYQFLVSSGSFAYSTSTIIQSSTQSADSYTFTNLLAGTTYYAEAIAFDAVGNISTSTAVSTVTLAGITLGVSTAAVPAAAYQGAAFAPLALYFPAVGPGSWTSLTVNIFGTSYLNPASPPADGDFIAAQIWKDVSGNGVFNAASDAILGQATVTGGTATIPITGASLTTGTTYFVVLQTTATAQVGDRIGMQIQGSSNFTLPSYLGLNNAFPLISTTTLILDATNVLYVTTTAVAPPSTTPGSSVAMLELNMSSLNGTSTLSTLGVHYTGSLAPGYVTVSVYEDLNHTGLFNPNLDPLVGSAQPFSLVNYATVTFNNPPLPATVSSVTIAAGAPLSYFVVANVSPLAVSNFQKISVQIDSATSLGLSGLYDTVSFSTTPISSPNVSVITSSVPTQPVVTLSSGPCSNSVNSIAFSWTSSVGAGFISSAAYAIGTSSGGADWVSWTRISPFSTGAVITDVFLATTSYNNLLRQGGTYYVSVIAYGNGYASQVGSSGPQIIDALPPGSVTLALVTSGPPPVINWTNPTSEGPSGLRGFLVEYQNVGSSTWYDAFNNLSLGSSDPTQVQLSTNNLISNTFLNLQSPPLPGGTLNLRAYAVSCPGLPSTASNVLRVQLGGGPSTALSGVSSYPNPFDSRAGNATILYTLESAGSVEIRIYSAFGVKLRDYTVTGEVGTNTTTWDGADDSGRKLAKGVYILEVSAGGATARWKIGVIH